MASPPGGAGNPRPAASSLEIGSGARRLKEPASEFTIGQVPDSQEFLSRQKRVAALTRQKRVKKFPVTAEEAQKPPVLQGSFVQALALVQAAALSSA
jgi:hypothetical protein